MQNQTGTPLTRALSDIWEGATRYHLWSALAAEDILDTYRRTSIGVLWGVFSFSFFALAIIVVFGFQGSETARIYTAHLVLGLLAWNFISTVIVQAPRVFVSNERFIKGSTLPLSIFTFQLTARTLVTSAFSAIGAAAFLFWEGLPRSWVALAALPAIAWLVITAIPVQLLLGSLGAFARDVHQITENMIRAVFFLTPVIWIPKPGTHLSTIAALNPVTDYIEIFRMPIANAEIPWEAWVACISVTAILWIVALAVFASSRRNIVFWI